MGPDAHVAAGQGRDRGGGGARRGQLQNRADSERGVDADPAAQEQRALRFALAEYDVKTYEVHAGDNLGAVLA